MQQLPQPVQLFDHLLVQKFSLKGLSLQWETMRSLFNKFEQEFKLTECSVDNSKF